jgi:alkyldihydroxyacetonephosphate synthase
VTEGPIAPTRRRNLWGWGFADRFPDLEARRTLAGLVRVLLPHSQPSPLPLPSQVAAVAPGSAAVPPAIASMCSADPQDRACHRRGKSYPDLVAGFSADYDGAPDFVARPGSAHEVSAILAECASHRLAIVPFGGGTSVVGGVDSSLGPWRDRFAGVVSLDLERLTGLWDLDVTSRIAHLGAGSTGPVLEAALAAHGMSLRCYPQSFELSTLGGWLATRAAGHYATGPTHIDDLCQAMTVITPRGVISTHRHPSSGAGPEPLRLLLGSEGTLGVITDAWMRIVARPIFRSSASVRFASFDAGVAATRALAQSGLMPSNARLLDGVEAKLHRVAFDGSSVLLLGFESADHPVESSLLRALELVADHGGTLRGAARHRRDNGNDATPGDSNAWRAAFLDAPYLQSALVSLGVMCDTFETSCTWSAFPSLHTAVLAAVGEILARQCGGGVVSCRFTHVYPDGPAPYYTFLAPAVPGRALQPWLEVKAAASRTLADHGGTITHHHAVGRTHVDGFRREVPELWRLGLSAIKDSWDPDRVLNPGVLGM